MGSTFTSGKCAESFRAPSGKIFYLVSEKTCESNVYPRTPSWSNVLFGDEEAIMKRIISSARSCYSGMLKGSGGSELKATNYIKAWRRELQNSRLLTRLSPSARFDDAGFSTIKTAGIPVIEATLQRHNFNQNDFIKTEDGKQRVEFDLTVMGVAEALSELMNSEQAGLSCWRLWPHAWGHDAQAGQGPVDVAQKSAKSAIDDFKLIYVGKDAYLVGDNTGKVMHSGWRYSVMGFVCDYLQERWSVTVPGLAESVLLDFEAQMDALELCADAQAFKVLTTTKDDLDRATRFARLVEKEQELIDNGFIAVSAADIRSRDLLWEFSRLNSEQIVVI